MSKALDRVKHSGLISKDNRAGIDRVKAALQEKQDELAGLNGFEKVPDGQLNAFAVYDVDRVQGYLHAVDRVYDHTLTTLKGQSPGFFEHHDCAEDAAYALPEMSEGVDVFYRPPRFGRLKHKQNHSGWECWRLPK